MINNDTIINFVKENNLFIGLFVLLIVRIIPPEWAGFWKYNNNKEVDGRAQRITLLRYILHSVVDSCLSSFLIPILSIFGLKNMVTLVILAVVIINVFVQQQISGPVVTLVGIGIITLYLDKLIDTGKSIKLFGGLVNWEKEIQRVGPLNGIHKIGSEKKDSNNNKKEKAT